MLSGPAAGYKFYLRSRVTDLCCWRFTESEFGHFFGRNFQTAEIALASLRCHQGLILCFAKQYVATVADFDIGHVTAVLSNSVSKVLEAHCSIYNR